MKHVTLFSQLAEYQAFMGGGDSLKPNVSYVREDSKVYSTGDVSEDFSGAVVYARYNITEDMSKTGLFNTSNVKALKVGQSRTIRVRDSVFSLYVIFIWISHYFG